MQLAASSSDQFMGHPKGLVVLFFTEMWERFSYYGMRALLTLYLTQHLLFGDAQASLIYGSYIALVYATPVIGGFLADRFLGLRKAVTLGAILLVLGHFGMAFEGQQAQSVMQDGVEIIQRDDFYLQIFYLSLAFIIIGVGFLKPNISTIVGKLYHDDDPRRDAGFTLFYMGINLGSLIAFLLCGYLGETYGWSYGFGAAGIGMLIGLLTFQNFQHQLQGHAEPPNGKLLTEKFVAGLSREHIIYIGAVLSVIVAWFMVQRSGELGQVLTWFGVFISIGIIYYSMSNLEPIDRDRMLVMFFLIVVSVFFWALFEQAGSSLTLFTARNVELGIMKASMFGFINPLFIIILALPFAWAWVRLAKNGREPSTPTKFGLGLTQVGLGFVILVYGASLAGPDGKVDAIWLVLMYLLHTTGELCLSPVGLSMVTKLSVKKITAFMMGVWFLSSSFAGYASGVIASLMAVEKVNGKAVAASESLSVYTDVFSQLAWIAIVLGVLLILISPVLQKRMHGIH